jgi:hypothetical protein
MTFGQDFSKLSYNVTALAQSDAQGFGPAYLLNGLTNDGYWYQVGVAFDWPYQSGGYDAGFNFLYETFDNTGSSVFPSGGGGGLEAFSGAVNTGDLILLQLSFSGGQVTFLAHDWKTGTTDSQSYPAQGSRFVGLHVSSGANGFFTGLMTEWYHVDPYYGTEAEVTYSNPQVQLVSATLWVDEFKVNGTSALFGDSQGYTFSDPNQLRLFSLDGATEYADAYMFITGSLGQTQITLSYAVSGGGSGYGAPLLSYIADGVHQSAELSATPTTYYADNGSRWQVSVSLPGGSPVERWQTDQVTNGTLTRPTAESMLYFHQYLCTFAYSVLGGGSGYSAPTGETKSFGSALPVVGNRSAWVDAGATFRFPQTLDGSSGSERWSARNSTLAIDGPKDVLAAYYHQVAVKISYLVAGGGEPSPPTLSGISSGAPFTSPVSNSSLYFLDQGTVWSLPSILPGSSLGERWAAPGNTTGTASSPQSVAVAYSHQYSFTAVPTPSAGGTVSHLPTWEEAGSTVLLSESPEAGWKFEGWTGSGGGSYSGPNTRASVVMAGPVTEDATFYPGLTIAAGPEGTVTFTSAAGTGTVAAGESAVIYAPQGSKITLHADPSSELYTFAGWTPSAGGASLSLTLDSAQVVSASFNVNPLFIVAVACVALAAVAGVLLYAVRKKGPTAPSSTL